MVWAGHARNYRKPVGRHLFCTNGCWQYYLFPQEIIDWGEIVPVGLRVDLAPFFGHIVLKDIGDEQILQLGTNHS